MADRVLLHEVGPRDGLQHEQRLIATQDKVALTDLLSDCGFARIEVTSFVRADWLPQLADAAAVMAAIRRRSGTAYTALTPNLRGYRAAQAARADAVAVFAAASESFSQRNINCSIAESFERFAPVMAAARRDGIAVRGYVSCVTDCPYEGQIAPAAAARVAHGLHALGCHEISLGDTIGRGTPATVAAVWDAVCALVPRDQLAGHFHDTQGRALENIEISLARGVRVFDVAAGGLGGCPYAPGASGNVASGAVVDRLARLGFETGIDRHRLAIAESFARSLISRDKIA